MGSNSVCGDVYSKQYEYIRLTDGSDIISAEQNGVMVNPKVSDAVYFDSDQIVLEGSVSNLTTGTVNFVAFDTPQVNPHSSIDQGVNLGSVPVSQYNTSGFDISNRISTKGRTTKYIYALVDETKAFAEYRIVTYNKSTLKTATNQPSDWDFSCGNGQTVEIIGYNTNDADNTGHTGPTSDVTVQIPNSGNVYQVVAEVAFKSTDPGPSVHVTANGQNYTLSEVIVSGSSSNIRVYRGVITGSISSVFMASNGAQSIVVYAYRNVTSNVVSQGYYTKRSGYCDFTTLNYTIPTSSSPRTINLEVPISEITNDGRYLKLTAKAGGQEDSKVINISENLPGGNCCLNIIDLSIPNVPGNTTTLTLEIDTRSGSGLNIAPSTNPDGCGQSWILASAVNIDTDCTPAPECEDCTVVNNCSFDNAWFGWATSNCDWSLGYTSYNEINSNPSIEYCNDGSAKVNVTIFNNNNTCEIWDVCMYLENPKDWAAWSAAGGDFMEDPHNLHESWTYYMLDESKSFWTGIGSCNSGQIVHMENSGSPNIGVQVGYGPGKQHRPG